MKRHKDIIQHQKNIIKTSSKHHQNIIKTSSKHHQPS